MAKNLGLCVIGLGVGWHHARAYADMADVDLYVCDLDSDKIACAGQEFYVVGTFSTVDEVLSSGAVEAVDIALPHNMHRPIAAQAAETGKHCISKKPTALDLREADEMIRAASRAGT